MMILIQAPISVQRPRLSDVSSVAQKVLAKFSIPLTDEWVGISNKQALLRWMDTNQPDQELADGVYWKS